MAKTSKYEHGATDMHDHDPVPIRREEITGNGGASSPGKNSTQSSENEQTSNGNEKVSPQPPAPTTENHSSPTEKAHSDAHSTGGNTRGTQHRRSAKKAVKKTAARKTAHTRTTDDAADDEDWE